MPLVMNGLLAFITVAASFTPVLAVSSTPYETGWVEYQPGGDTLCARGAPFAFFVKLGTSDKVMVDFIGGGACWSPDTCAASAGMFSEDVENVRAVARGENVGGIYDQDNPANPFRDWTRVVVPYCTGDLHWGAQDTTYQPLIGRPFTIHHRGAINARAALDWAMENLPQPREMLVSGCSAGSYGAAYWTPLLAERYPGTRLRELGESGVGVVKDDFMGQAIRNWNLTANAPAWVPGLDPAVFDWSRLSMTDFYNLTAAHYPDATFAQFTADRDLIQTLFFARMGGRPSQWRGRMYGMLDAVELRTPNFRTFVAPGDGHCVTIDDGFYKTESNGQSFASWLDRYANTAVLPDSVRCTNCAR